MKGITFDSRKVEPGFAFVAIPGQKVDGYNFIPQAIKNGASLVIAERDFDAPPGVEKKIVPNARIALAELSAEFYGNPAKKLTLIGITGTNGKTTTAYLIESILETAGFKVGNLGTVDTPTGLTTPESLDLQKYLSECVKQGVTHVVMEVSSHALAQFRIWNLSFDIAIFTNLTHDHLDFHKTMDEYLAAKIQLFKQVKIAGVTIINSDDPASNEIISQIDAEVMTYGIREAKFEYSPASVEKIITRPDGMRLTIDSTEIKTPLVGLYNVYNILAAFSCALALKIDRKKIKLGIEMLKVVPGRFERIANNKGFKVIVDFAHSPDALEKLLVTIREINKEGKIILVFGAPGDRDREKRPIMGEIAARLADSVIVTTDDPHTEEPEQIIRDIVDGISKSKIQNPNNEKIINRKEAIQKALSLAKKGDVVVLAGRGHETCQDFNGKKVAIDDRIVAKEWLHANA